MKKLPISPFVSRSLSFKCLVQSLSCRSSIHIIKTNESWSQGSEGSLIGVIKSSVLPFISFIYPVYVSQTLFIVRLFFLCYLSLFVRTSPKLRNQLISWLKSLWTKSRGPLRLRVEFRVSTFLVELKWKNKTNRLPSQVEPIMKVILN